VAEKSAGRVVVDAAGRADGPSPYGWPRRVRDLEAEQRYPDRFKAAMQARMGQQVTLEMEDRVRRTWEQGLDGRLPTDEDRVRLQSLLAAERERYRRREDEFAPLDEAELLEQVRVEFGRLAAGDAS